MLGGLVLPPQRAHGRERERERDRGRRRKRESCTYKAWELLHFGEAKALMIEQGVVNLSIIAKVDFDVNSAQD